MDFTYKDVSDLLDRIARIHESEGEELDEPEPPKDEELEGEKAEQ